MTPVFTPKKEHAIVIVDGLLLVYSPSKVFTDGDWAAHCENLRRAMQPGHGVTRVLVYSPNGGPNAAQRNILRQAAQGLPTVNLPRMALISASAIVRMSLGAVRIWLKTSLGADLRSFSPNELDKAVQWLGIDPQVVKDALQSVSHTPSA